MSDDSKKSPTATAIAVIENGAVTSLALTNMGSGYATAPTVIFIGGGGYGASAIATVSNGNVSELRLLAGGHGYTESPAVLITLEHGAALLSYSMLSNPNPLQIPQSNADYATLTLVVSNGGREVVDCAAILITLPGPGDNAAYLTNSFEDVGTQVPQGSDGKPGWLVQRDGGMFTLTPVSADAGRIAEAGLVFVFDKILVNSRVGECAVQVTELSATPTQPASRRAAPSIELQKWPAAFSIGGPTATELEVAYDGSTLITWSVTGQDVTSELLYDLDGKGTKRLPIFNHGAQKFDHLTNPGGVTFTVQATLPVPGQSEPLVRQAQIHVDVIAQPKVEFKIQPNPVAPGRPVSFTLCWSLVDVASFQITADDGQDGNSYTLPVPFSLKGHFPVVPRKLGANYTLQVLSTPTGQ